LTGQFVKEFSLNFFVVSPFDLEHVINIGGGGGHLFSVKNQF